MLKTVIKGSKMSDMKCPFCGRELEEKIVFRGRVFMSCDNPNCIISDWGGCSKQIITELIRTRKALGIAVDALKVYANPENWDCEHFYSLDTYDIAGDALEQITALEQKD